MNKILIIGQAPPEHPQELPYDTTLLYDMFSWVGINKIEAQHLFEFDALVDKFPGKDSKGNHLLPQKWDIEEYWEFTLKEKFNKADKILILGNIARSFIQRKFPIGIKDKQIIFLIHPSKRNRARINYQKHNIIKDLKKLIK